MPDPAFSVSHGVQDGFATVELACRTSDLAATFVPGANLLGTSLIHRGEELLGQRKGLRNYVEAHGTMGIPLLHPWANRVSERSFEVAGKVVDTNDPELPLSFDDNGLVKHGLLSGAFAWTVSSLEAGRDSARMRAGFSFSEHPDLLAAFPFGHELSVDVELTDETLSLTTSVTAGGDGMPIAFGYHPYLRLPRVPRSQWRYEAPVSEHLILDAASIPTGERERIDGLSGTLGSSTFDDVYAGVDPARPFVLAGGGRRLEVRFESGYPVAVVFAPGNDDVVAFEPMTAPTDALVSGAPELTTLAAGESYDARFSITVLDD